MTWNEFGTKAIICNILENPCFRHQTSDQGYTIQSEQFKFTRNGSSYFKRTDLTILQLLGHKLFIKTQDIPSYQLKNIYNQVWKNERSCLKCKFKTCKHDKNMFTEPWWTIFFFSWMFSLVLLRVQENVTHFWFLTLISPLLWLLLSSMSSPSSFFLSFVSTLVVGMHALMERVSAYLPAFVRRKWCLSVWKAVKNHYAFRATDEDDLTASGWGGGGAAVEPV